MVRAKVLLPLLGMALLVAAVAHLAYVAVTCDGTLVRGVLSMQCVEEARRD